MSIEYFNSIDVKAFPCSYRGYKDTSGAITVYDPESRLNSEYNYIHSASTASKKQSYVIDEDDNILKCVIGGYYFEIKNISSYKNNLKNKTLGITLRKVEFDNNYSSYVLTATTQASQTNSPDTLTSDLYLDTADGKFLGIGIGNEDDLAGCNDTLVVYDSLGNIIEENLLLNLENGTGAGSLKQINAGIANGINSVAFGLGTVTTNEGEFACGEYNKSNSGTLFSIGNGDHTTRNNILEISNSYTYLASPTIKLDGRDSYIYVDDEQDTIDVYGRTTNISGEDVKIVATNAIDLGSSLFKTNKITGSNSSDTLKIFNNDIKLDAQRIELGDDGTEDIVLFVKNNTSYSSLTLTKNLDLFEIHATSDKNVITCPDTTFTGTVKAQAFYATSDKRLKENVVEYKPEKSILDLPVYKFDFINGAKNNIGCLAQDLKEICPEIVNENSNGYLSINESKIVYLLLDEVKKLKKEIEELKK